MSFNRKDLLPQSKVNKIWLKPSYFVSDIYIKKIVLSVCLCPLDLDTSLSTYLPHSTNPLHIHQLSLKRVWGRLYTQHHCTRFKRLLHIEYKKSATKKETTLQIQFNFNFKSTYVNISTIRPCSPSSRLQHTVIYNKWI